MPPIKPTKELDLMGTLHNLTDAFMVRAQAGDPDDMAAVWVLRALQKALGVPDSEALGILESAARRVFEAQPDDVWPPPFPLARDWTERLANGVEKMRIEQATSAEIASYAIVVCVQSQPNLPALLKYHAALKEEASRSLHAPVVATIERISPQLAPKVWSEWVTRAILKTLEDPQHSNAPNLATKPVEGE